MFLVSIMLVITAKHVGNPNRVLLPAGSKLSVYVLKHSFAQEIIVTLMQHQVVFFNILKLAVTFASETEPQLFLACS